MNELIDILNKLKRKYKIEDYYTWNFSDDVPITIPDYITDNFSRNIYLKENYHTALENDINLKNHYWIIQKWGGITSLKQNDRNDMKIKKFKEELNKDKLTKDSFNTISSFSKIASFMDSEKYVIYDSRVIYSLNWLLFNYTNIKELYPQPSGRNPKTSLYDMATIIRLANQNHIYKSHKIAYHDYCKLLTKLSKEVYGEAKPYKLEMLLFILAPSEIVESIKSSVSISFKSF